MSRWVVALALVLGSGTAFAQSADPAPPVASPASADVAADTAAKLQAAADATARAQAAAATADRDAGQRAAARQTLAATYEQQLRAIDRQKQQRPSWRRDRELRDSLTSSLETAKQLDAATAAVAAAQQQAVATHRAWLAAIDAELALAPAAPRVAQLTAARATVAAHVGVAPHRIVIPDSEIDPLADPEELDQQAAALRDSERELTKQVAVLDAQAAELHRVAELRKQHDRAGDLANRDDDQAHRAAVRGSTSGDTLSPVNGSATISGTGSSGHDNTVPGANSQYEGEAAIVLADVVDSSTIDSLGRAQRSGDPTQRAVAAEHIKLAVAARLAQLQQRRAAIEARAKLLRTNK